MFKVGGGVMTVLVNAIVMVGMFLVVPAGLRLAGLAELDRIRRFWPLFAAPGALALWLPRGTTATALALCYALGTVLLALHAPRRALRGRDLSPPGSPCSPRSSPRPSPRSPWSRSDGATSCSASSWRSSR